MILAQATLLALNETGCEDCVSACFYIGERCVIVASKPEVVAEPDFDGAPTVRCGESNGSVSKLPHTIAYVEDPRGE